MIKNLTLTALAAGTFALTAMNAVAGEVSQELRLDIAPGGTLHVINNVGSVTLHAGTGKQLIAAYNIHSDKVEVDHSITPDKRRVELVTHAANGQKPAADEARVDYQITVPAHVAVIVATVTAPILADGLSGDLSFSSDTGQITVRNVARIHVHVRGVTAPVSLSNIALADVDVASSGGTVDMLDVAGPKVSVGTTSGNISYRGDCSGAGEYSFTTHSGAIDAALPETASFDLSARSISGSVQNDFPLTQKAHTAFVPNAGRSFAGTSNSGSSSVELQSFSGKIRVKKL